MNKRVIIVGAGGHAKVVADIVRKSSDEVVGFLDDDATRIGMEFFGSKILGKCMDYRRYADDCSFILALGNNATRKRLSEEMQCRWYTAIHPSAVLGENSQIGEGCCIAAGAVINPNAKIGKHTIINSCAVAEHDVEIGDYTHLSPNSTVCGMTKIGALAWIGAGSTVIQGLSVCDGVTVGAGSVVIRSLEEAGTYVGAPARKI